MKIFLRAVSGVLFLALLSVGACTKSEHATGLASVNANEIVFGEYGSMTGEESTFGVSTHKGIMMAVAELNRAGGIKGKQIRLVSYDDQGKTDEAVTAVTKLITQDKVNLVLGEVASSRSIAAGSVAQANHVPMISPSSTNIRVTQTGDYIFRVCFVDSFQGLVMAKFAFDELKLKKAAVFRDIKSDYSMGLAQAFEDSFKKLGGTIVAESAYSSGDMDFKSQLTALKEKGPDLIFIPGYYTEVGLIARQAREMGIQGPMLGGDGWDSDKLEEIGGKSIVGSYFSAHYSPEDKNPAVQNFVNQYRARYSETPNSLAAMGYDATKIAADAVNRAKDLSPTSIRDAIAATQNFQGVTGIITLNKDRNAIKPAVVLKVMEGDKYQYVTTVNP